jgi:hypothetical protein
MEDMERLCRTTKTKNPPKRVSVGALRLQDPLESHYNGVP